MEYDNQHCWILKGTLVMVPKFYAQYKIKLANTWPHNVYVSKSDIREALDIMILMANLVGHVIITQLDKLLPLHARTLTQIY